MIPNTSLNNFKQPLKNSRLIDEAQVNVGPNLAAALPFAKLQTIYMWMMQNYIQPQLMSRRPYEKIWDLLYDAYRLRLKIKDLKLKDDDTRFLDNLIDKAKENGGQDMNITDTLIFDTVDRMANLTHFIAWKDGIPVQYNPPRYLDTSMEDRFYAPTEAKYKASNCILNHFTGQEMIYRKQRLGSKDHFLYGISYVLSDLKYQLEVAPQGEVSLTHLSVSYEPISIRKVWLNYLLPIAKMNQQPCPFFYEYAPEFAILQNEYDPALNPFGFVNLDKLNAKGYTDFSSMGEQSFKKALEARLLSSGESLTVYDGQDKKIAALWNFLPMLPLDPETGDFITYGKDHPSLSGQRVPYKRFYWQQYGTDIVAAQVVPIRLQECNFYGENLPLFGSTHLDDLDSGAYAMSICEALINYCIELSRCREQYIFNKDQINNPPTWHTVGSPSMNQDVNRAGAKIEVVGPNDFGWKTTIDATQTTVQMCEHLRDRAQTTSKAVDALMGKAMGGRTSATEAQNVFQAAMSGVTTDINMFNFDTMGQYALRVWAFAKWFDPDLIKALCGTYGLVTTKDDFNLNFSLKFDVGSSFIESIVKQGHIRYFLEAGSRSPAIDQGVLFTALAEELKMSELKKAIIPDGMSRDVTKAGDQAIQTFLGRQVMIDPSQNHQIAIEVKIRYLEDQTSVWMLEYGTLQFPGAPLTRAQMLSEQIKIHQVFWQQEMLQQQAEAIANLQMSGDSRDNGSSFSDGAPSASNSGATQSQGQALSQTQQ